MIEAGMIRPQELAAFKLISRRVVFSAVSGIEEGFSPRIIRASMFAASLAVPFSLLQFTLLDGRRLTLSRSAARFHRLKCLGFLLATPYWSLSFPPDATFSQFSLRRLKIVRKWLLKMIKRALETAPEKKQFPIKKTKLLSGICLDHAAKYLTDYKVPKKSAWSLSYRKDAPVKFS